MVQHPAATAACLVVDALLVKLAIVKQQPGNQVGGDDDLREEQGSYDHPDPYECRIGIEKIGEPRTYSGDPAIFFVQMKVRIYAIHGGVGHCLVPFLTVLVAAYPGAEGCSSSFEGRGCCHAQLWVGGASESAKKAEYDYQQHHGDERGARMSQT